MVETKEKLRMEKSHLETLVLDFRWWRGRGVSDLAEKCGVIPFQFKFMSD